MQPIDFDGFDECPQLRSELLLFIDQYCAHMTLADVKEWFDDSFACGSAAS